MGPAAPWWLRWPRCAKPAHGGILPAAKITSLIAEARGLGDGPWLTDCASPPRHSAFGSPAELIQFVQQLRELSGGKPIGFKLCVGQPHEFAALCHAMLDANVAPDFVTVDGTEGGTGAAPPEFQDSIGMPLAEGLRIVDGFLTGAGLRDEVKVIAGNHKGKQGKVLEVHAEREQVIVEGVRVMKKSVRRSEQNPDGGIIEKDGPIHISNVKKLTTSG